MSGNVVQLSDHRPAPVREEGCSCRPDHLCYPHRLTNAAALLRAEVKAAREIDWLTPTRDLERIAADVLAVLDGITAECLPEHTTTPPTVDRLRAACHTSDEVSE